MIELCCNASLAGSLGHIQQAGTVKSRLSRGRKLLREALSDTDQGGTVWIS